MVHAICLFWIIARFVEEMARVLAHYLHSYGGLHSLHHTLYSPDLRIHVHSRLWTVRPSDDVDRHQCPSVWNYGDLHMLQPRDAQGLAALQL